MCLISLAYNVHPKYPLILMGNRDEFRDRPTQQAHHWPQNLGIIAGKDLKAGGTWLGVNEKRPRLGVLTNYRDLSLKPVENPVSRGGLVLDYLTNDLDPEAYWSTLNLKSYEGFNLLLWDKDRLFYGSNMGESFWVEPGIHSLSNHLLNTPWPKVEAADQAMKQLVSADVNSKVAMKLMANNQKAPDEKLPKTGIPLPMEQLLSSMFIDSPQYGTRCSTFFKLDLMGHWHFEELTWENDTVFTYKGLW